MVMAVYQPELLDELYKAYGFEAILIKYPDPEPKSVFYDSDNNSEISFPGWALVYWDDLSLIYLRKGRQNDAVIREDEYQYVSPTKDSATSMLHIDDSQKHIFRELQRNIEETGSSKAYAFLGSWYLGMGLYQQAIEAFSHVRAFPTAKDHLLDRYGGIGYAYSQLGNLDEALRTYKQALDLPLVSGIYCFNIGNIYFRKNDSKNAIKYLEKALKIDNNIVSAYPLLISLYYKLDRISDAKRTEERYKNALIVKGGEEHNNLGRKAFAAGRIDIAIDEFKRAIEINSSNPSFYSNLGGVYFNIGVTKEAYEYQQSALKIDPNYAMAYYWLGHIYKNSGNAAMAIKCFEEYRRIEPKGYLSRKAEQYIIELSES
jgi:tetratricopeptide (TPR) repeat protein